MTIATDIIARLGGTRAAAKLLDKPPSTVQSWKGSGFIPARYQSEILRRAQRAGIAMRASDLVGLDQPQPDGEHPTSFDNAPSSLSQKNAA
ncbi:carph-isopro domain-containing protein [Asaia prunellae]|uniref:carph-isopro domain-containing protein n=1 Tax=Asaia prunellae TaxID=610245 RepID=UPI0034E27618